MSYIHLSSVKFRRPIPERPSDTMHVIQQLKAEFTSTAQRSQENATSTDGDANCRTPEDKEPCSMETTPPTAEWLGSGREGRSHAHSWVESSIPAHWVWPSHYSKGGPFGRHSTCELEVDASVEGTCSFLLKYSSFSTFKALVSSRTDLKIEMLLF